MPFTPLQRKSIQARAHGWRGPGAFRGVSAAKAKKMLTEGTRAPVQGPRAQAAAIERAGGG